jgi:hypothetical protein
MINFWSDLSFIRISNQLRIFTIFALIKILKKPKIELCSQFHELSRFVFNAYYIYIIFHKSSEMVKMI